MANVLGESGMCLNRPVFQEKMFNPFPNKPWFLHVCSSPLPKYFEAAISSETLKPWIVW